MVGNHALRLQQGPCAGQYKVGLAATLRVVGKSERIGAIQLQRLL